MSATATTAIPPVDLHPFVVGGARASVRGFPRNPPPCLEPSEISAWLLGFDFAEVEPDYADNIRQAIEVEAAE